MPEREINLLRDKERAQCHLMPCRIESKDERIKAKEYFYPTIRELKAGGDDDQGREIKKDKPTSGQASGASGEEQPILLASFRGRPLQGRKVKLPDGYTGYMVARNKTNSERSFDEFTYWNWDELPSENDAICKAVRWVNVAKYL